jgi:O-antigen ligase
MTSFIVFAWVVKMIGQKRILLKRSIVDIPLILLFISFALSTLFSIDQHTSLWGYYGRFNGGLVSILCYVLLYYAFISNVSTEYVSKLLKISLISSVLVMLWAIPGKLGYDMSCYVFTGQLSNSCWTDQFRPSERIFSTLGQPNWLGAYLAIHFFIGLYFLLKRNTSTLCRILFISYIALNFICTLFTRSRSSLLSIIIGLAILGVYFILKQDFFRKVFRDIAIVLSILLVSILTFKSGVEKLDHYLRISTYIQSSSSKPTVEKKEDNSIPLIERYDVTDSLDIRKIVWEGATELGKRYPLFGTGLETFAYSYYFVRPQSHNLTSEWDYLYNKAHNEYLNYLATAGYIGLTTYLSFIGTVLFVFIRILAKEELEGEEDASLLKLSLLMSFSTILVTNFFGFSTTTISLFFYIIPALALVSPSVEDKKAIYNFHLLKQKLAVAATVGGLIFMSTQIYLYWTADTLYKRGDDLYRTGEYNTSAYYLNQAIKIREEHVYEDKLSYVAANLALLLAEKKTDSAKNLMSVAEVYNKKSLQSSPKNVLYWKTRAKNMYLFYQIKPDIQYIKSGLNALEEAAKLSPTDPKISYTAAIFYSLLYDTDETQKSMYRDKSMAGVNKSIDLKPDYRDSYFLKAQLQHKFGMVAEAHDTIQYILTKINPNDQEAKDLLKELK